uniref:beta-carotene 3-hydroxylase n=1 Tax=Oryza sativa subsp. japonica TaxID=39947 RepID=Q10SE6_ORYSJ|nr:beta-carotene hydroxylase, putative, expressed [Oryza sativa Japonica Group]
MAVARLVAARAPLLSPAAVAAAHRSPPALLRLAFAPLPARRLAVPLRVAVGEPEPEEDARRAVAERAARKQSERRTYLVAAVMSSLGITSMAAAAVYYRFAWQMERRDPGHGNVRHLRAIGGRRGGDGVLGAVGAPGAVARVAVAHARVAPPPARRAVRAQRRLRHHQRRPGHVPPRLRLLHPRPRPRPLLRRGTRDHAVRDGVHVRPRRPGPPPLPGGAHRQRALLPAGRRRPPDTSHGQVRRCAIWAVPWSQGAGGGGWD